MNTNDLKCPYCQIVFSYTLIGYKESYIDHIHVHIAHLTEERDTLKKIVEKTQFSFNLPKSIFKEQK